jgi:hypothetical protein
MSAFKDVCDLFGVDDTHRMYGVFKDFQTLLAAVIALVAAAIAYLSAQRAARTQAKTALRVQKQQFEETRATEERARIQRECAMIITLRVKFELVERYLNLRLTWIEQIKKYCDKAPIIDEGYLVDDHLTLWIFFRDVKSISDEALIYDIGKDEISNLHPRNQTLYHSICSLVSNYDRRHADTVSLTLTTSPKTIYAASLAFLKEAATETIDFISVQRPNLEEAIETLCKEFEANRKQESLGGTVLPESSAAGRHLRNREPQ